MAKPEDENMELAAAAGEAAPVAEGNAEAPVKSKKDTYLEGFRKNNPDWQDDDEEGFYGRLSDQEAAWNSERDGYQKREKEVTDAIANGGVLNAALFNEVLAGTPIPLALAKKYPEEIMDWLNDPNNTDKLEAALQSHADTVKKDSELDEEAKKNLEETNALLDEMVANGEIKDDEECNQLLEFLGKVATGLMMNHLEKDWLIAAKNALNHDADVEAARTQGEIAGRNEKISAQRKATQRGGNTHSGLGSGNAGQRLTPKETKQALGENTGRRSMWAGAKVNKLN